MGRGHSPETMGIMRDVRSRQQELNSREQDLRDSIASDHYGENEDVEYDEYNDVDDDLL